LQAPATTFGQETKISHETDSAAAVARTKTLLVPGSRIFLQNIDTDDWSEILS